jgi:hypothetical protein
MCVAKLRSWLQNRRGPVVLCHVEDQRQLFSSDSTAMLKFTKTIDGDDDKQLLFVTQNQYRALSRQFSPEVRKFIFVTCRAR